MLWSTDFVVTESIIFFSIGLFVYWVKRALLIIAESQEEIDHVLDSDLWWGRRCWLALRILLNPSSQFLSI